MGVGWQPPEHGLPCPTQFHCCSAWFVELCAAAGNFEIFRERGDRKKTTLTSRIDLGRWLPQVTLKDPILDLWFGWKTVPSLKGWKCGHATGLFLSRSLAAISIAQFNFEKWSDVGVFCTFWLGNVLRATTACNFSSLIWPAGSAPAALASLPFDPPEPQILKSLGKHSVS